VLRLPPQCLLAQALPKCVRSLINVQQVKLRLGRWKKDSLIRRTNPQRSSRTHSHPLCLSHYCYLALQWSCKPIQFNFLPGRPTRWGCLTMKRAGFPGRGEGWLSRQRSYSHPPCSIVSIKFCLTGKEESQQRIRGADAAAARKTSSSSDPLMV